MKICVDCKQKFPAILEYFYRANVTGLSNRCIPCAKIKARKYYKQNTKRCNKNSRAYHAKNKLKVMRYYGGDPPKCSCPGCGEYRLEFLTIDHINGDGRKHRRDIKINSGLRFYDWLVKNSFPEGFRVLCYNCNCSRGHLGYCPHEKEVDVSSVC